MKAPQSKSRKYGRWLNPMLVACLILAVFLGACQPAPTPAPPTATPAPTLTYTPLPTATITLTPTPADTATPEATPTPAQIELIGAGEIVNCGNPGYGITADLLAQFPGVTIFTAGDNSNVIGTPNEFKKCFGPTWGRFLASIHPAVGDHEYYNKGAKAYFDYFGAAAGTPGQGWYSYDLGGWHIIVLNSQCAQIGGCEAGSAQEKWLKDDLAAHPAHCSMAVWHIPRYNLSLAQGLPFLDDIWNDLYKAGVELVVNAHHYYYARFAPMDPSGKADDARGIREFIVGTGGSPLDKRNWTCSRNCQAFEHDTLGLLKLTLHPDGYDWAFVPEPGKTFNDAGSGTCH
jgi:hypothetical protein